MEQEGESVKEPKNDSMHQNENANRYLDTNKYTDISKDDMVLINLSSEVPQPHNPRIRNNDPLPRGGERPPGAQNEFNFDFNKGLLLTDQESVQQQPIKDMSQSPEITMVRFHPVEGQNLQNSQIEEEEKKQQQDESESFTKVDRVHAFRQGIDRDELTRLHQAPVQGFPMTANLVEEKHNNEHLLPQEKPLLAGSSPMVIATKGQISSKPSHLLTPQHQVIAQPAPAVASIQIIGGADKEEKQQQQLQEKPPVQSKMPEAQTGSKREEPLFKKIDTIASKGKINFYERQAEFMSNKFGGSNHQATFAPDRLPPEEQPDARDESEEFIQMTEIMNPKPSQAGTVKVQETKGVVATNQEECLISAQLSSVQRQNGLFNLQEEKTARSKKLLTNIQTSEFGPLQANQQPAPPRFVFNLPQVKITSLVEEEKIPAVEDHSKPLAVQQKSGHRGEKSQENPKPKLQIHFPTPSETLQAQKDKQPQRLFDQSELSFPISDQKSKPWIVQNEITHKESSLDEDIEPLRKQHSDSPTKNKEGGKLGSRNFEKEVPKSEIIGSRTLRKTKRKLTSLISSSEDLETEEEEEGEFEYEESSLIDDISGRHLNSDEKDALTRGEASKKSTKRGGPHHVQHHGEAHDDNSKPDKRRPSKKGSRRRQSRRNQPAAMKRRTLKKDESITSEAYQGRVDQLMKQFTIGRQQREINTKAKLDELHHNEKDEGISTRGDCGAPSRKRPQVKLSIQELKDEIKKDIDEQIRQDYLQKFRKEVDFHHKVAYRFEKAYRLGRKHPEKQKGFDIEIIEVISDHSDYLEHDPMAIFYCLYFCIYYRNQFIFTFLKQLIENMSHMQVMEQNDKIDFLLKQIEMHGVDRLRTSGDILNRLIYHVVFYQAIDDRLRIVYANIMRKLKSIQMRDKDGKTLIETQDFALIMEAFQKTTIRVNVQGLFKIDSTMLSTTYRQYDSAYFEEVILNYNVEKRMAQKYRERFLINNEAIFQVCQMYAKKDHLDHFLKVEGAKLNKTQLTILFKTCIRSDSFKMALHIYLSFLDHNDMTPEIMMRLMLSLRDSEKFHEEKLFFIHEHFKVMDIFLLNKLLDILLVIYFRPEHKKNPMVSQYNVIKYALLVYKVSWNIEQQKIYSLITKCQMLNKYILSSLNSYLEIHGKVEILSKMMLEPILNLQFQKDSLDIMLEMNMEETLNHPVIVEILNLVYEGQYSVNSPAIYLSETFWCFFDLKVNESREILSRLIQNLKALAMPNNRRHQTGLQFHIWKNCLQQRLMDEAIFVIIFSILFMYYSMEVQVDLSKFLQLSDNRLGVRFFDSSYGLIQNNELNLALFCQPAMNTLVHMMVHFQALMKILWVISFSVLTSLLQKILTIRLKENAELETSMVLLELAIIVSAGMSIYKYVSVGENELMLDVCNHSLYHEVDTAALNKMYYLVSDIGHLGSLQVAYSSTLLTFMIYMIQMLRRNERFSQVVTLMTELVGEIFTFAKAFGLAILAFLIFLRLIHPNIQHEYDSLGDHILDTFDGFLGAVRYNRYIFPNGQLVIMMFSFFSKVFLFGILVTMLVIRYKNASKKIEASRRMEIIQLKNSQCYDRVYGAITMTYFPINIILIPFLLPLIILKSERLSDAVLKFQYFILIICYCSVGLALTVVLLPLIYLKVVANTCYLQVQQKDRTSKIQKVANIIKTIVISPVLIIGSLCVDILALQYNLMIEEKHFEYKYQVPEIVWEMDKIAVFNAFFRIFITEFDKKYFGKSKTELQLMQQHIEIFQIRDNFHSFFCRGDKSYKDSMANVKLFNMTKELASVCSLPNSQGQTKLNVCEYDVISHNFLDVNLFNYYHKYLQTHKKGQEMSQYEQVLYGFIHRNFDYKRYQLGLDLARVPSDFMKTFSISSVAQAFTDIRKQVKEHQLTSGDILHSNRKLNFLIHREESKWKQQVLKEWDSLLSTISEKIRVQAVNIKFGKKPKPTDISTVLQQALRKKYQESSSHSTSRGERKDLGIFSIKN